MKTLEQIWDLIKDKTLQHKEEFLWLLQLIIDREYKSVIEVGSYKGGTARGFLEVGCYTLCIDKDPHPDFITTLKPFDYQLYKLDSTKCTFLSQWIVDVLYIDGDHSYEGCKSDFEKLKHAVKPGGIIAFHDINPKDENNEYGSSVFWNEIKHLYKYEEKIVHPETWGGIAVIYV